MGAGNIVCGEGHGHFVRMAGCLLVNAVNQVHGALRVVSLELRLDPDGKELCSQIALLDLVQIDMAFAYGRVLAEVKVFVQEALRRVRVCIHDEGRVVDCQGRISLGPSYLRGLGSFLMWSCMLWEPEA